MTPPLLSIVMPAWNEEAAIENVVREHADLLEIMGGSVPPWEIVVVDDGSTDQTAALLDSLQGSISRLRVIRQENQGIFGAFNRAYKEARGSYIYSTGSDGQWPAGNLIRMLEALNGGADLVIGVRINRRTVYSPVRRLISWAFNGIPRLLFGVPVHDAGSVKLGRAEAFRFDLISRSPFFEAERIIRAQRAGMKVAFVPIAFRGRRGGHASGASWANIRRSLSDVARCATVYSFR